MTTQGLRRRAHVAYHAHANHAAPYVSRGVAR